MITVIGSSSIDFVVDTDRMPNIGETMMGNSFETFFGGKGANQAVGIARLGMDVAMIGCVGDDTFGQEIITNLSANGVDTSAMRIVDNMASGSAHIFIESGENRIIVVAGANSQLSVRDIDAQRSLIEKSKLVLVQYEIPSETIEHVAKVCEQLSIPLVINPAPMKIIDVQALERATYLTPNEVETKQLFPTLSLKEAVKKFPNKLIVTQGSDGVLYTDGDEMKVIAAHNVSVVDTTGAGDAFNAGFCVGIVEGLKLNEAIDFGNLVASHSIQKKGAQSGLPFRRELLK